MSTRRKAWQVPSSPAITIRVSAVRPHQGVWLNHGIYQIRILINPSEEKPPHRFQLRNVGDPAMRDNPFKQLARTTSDLWYSPSNNFKEVRLGTNLEINPMVRAAWTAPAWSVWIDLSDRKRCRTGSATRLRLIKALIIRVSNVLGLELKWFTRISAA